MIRFAMWSGPRNISTAMMRSWGNRSDTVVIDEPFYAYFLKATGKNHPGADEIVATGETDWRKVVQELVGSEVPGGRKIFYQKQMTHHLLPEIDRGWIRGLTNCFLIRDPGEVIASYIKRRENPSLEDLGFVQQAEIFDLVSSFGGQQTVIDVRDVLESPEQVLRLLCDSIGVDFQESMLSWPPGLRETDGVWAKYWYDDVARSTSFRLYRQRTVEIPKHLLEIYERCRESYERLYQRRLRLEKL